MRAPFFYRMNPRANKIWLSCNKPDPLYNYTFLESNLVTVDKSARYDLLFNLKDEMKTHAKDIRELLSSDPSREMILNYKQLNDAAKIYQNLLKEARTLISGQQQVTYYVSVRMLCYANIMNPEIWQIVFNNLFKNYGQISSNDVKALKAVNQYFKKFHVRNTDYTRFKFCFDENEIPKFAPFRSQFQRIFENQSFHSLEQEIELSELFQKVRLVQDIDVFGARRYYLKNLAQIQNALSKLSEPLESLCLMYSIYAKYGATSPEIIKFFEERIQKAYPLTNNAWEKQFYAINLVNTWKEIGSHNPATFQIIKKNILRKTLGNDTNTIINALHSMVCSGINDKQLFTKNLQLVNDSLKRTNSSIITEKGEALRHILAIRGYSPAEYIPLGSMPRSFAENHPDIISILLKKFPKSKRLQTASKQIRIKTNAPMNQHNKILAATEKYFTEAMRKHLDPNGPFKLLIGPYFFHYEIDIVLIEGDDIYAIQIMGEHYKGNQNNIDGKSKMKFQLLSYYGIELIKIDCSRNQVSKVSQTSNASNKPAYDYIMSRVEQVRQNKSKPDIKTSR